MFALLAWVPIDNNIENVAMTTHAGLCSGMGPGLHSSTRGVGGALSRFPASEARHRRWTVQELFSGEVNFTAYHGQGEGQAFLGDSSENRGHQFAGMSNDEAHERVGDIRNIGRCFMNGPNRWVPNGLLSMASGLARVVSNAVTMLYSPEFICRNPANPTGGCINLIQIIGGNGAADGIIGGSVNGGVLGQLTLGLYYPLMILISMAAAVHALFKFLTKRVRESLQSLLWTLLITTAGIVALAFPAALAQLPMTINNTVATCILAAMNGENCFTAESSEIVAPFIGPECISTAADLNTTETAEMLVNSLACSIWTTFVLEPWTQGQFGRQWNELYTIVPPQASTWGLNVWHPIAETGDTYANRFCVTMASNSSASTFTSTPVNLNRDTGNAGQICHAGLYHLYVRSGFRASSQTGSPGEFRANTNRRTEGNVPPEYRFYNIIGLSALHDEVVFRNWTSSGGGGIAQWGHAITALIVVFIAGIALVWLSLTGLVFYVGGVILMVFAPIMFLLAIHPGKGKKIFLGWVEMVVGNILKYIVSAALALAALIIFSAGLENTNHMNSILFVTIMTIVLLMYRKEILNLMGQANMGGQKMSNVLGDRLNKARNSAWDKTKVIAGGAVGAKAAGGSMKAGAKDAFWRDMKRGRGATAEFARSKDRIRAGLDKNFEEQRSLQNKKGQLETDNETAKHERHTTAESDYQKELNEIRNNMKQMESNIKADSVRAYNQADIDYKKAFEEIGLKAERQTKDVHNERTNLSKNLSASQSIQTADMQTKHQNAQNELRSKNAQAEDIKRNEFINRSVRTKQILSVEKEISHLEAQKKDMTNKMSTATPDMQIKYQANIDNLNKKLETKQLSKDSLVNARDNEVDNKMIPIKTSLAKAEERQKNAHSREMESLTSSLQAEYTSQMNKLTESQNAKFEAIETNANNAKTKVQMDYQAKLSSIKMQTENAYKENEENIKLQTRKAEEKFEATKSKLKSLDKASDEKVARRVQDINHKIEDINNKR